VTDSEVDTNNTSMLENAGNRIGDKLESVKDLIESHSMLEKLKSNYRTTKKQAKVVNDVLKKCERICKKLDITAATLDMDTATVSNLPHVFEVLKGELDSILRKGLSLTCSLKHTHLLELAEQIQNDSEYPGASGTYCILLELSKCENQVKFVISQQVRLASLPSAFATNDGRTS